MAKLYFRYGAMNSGKSTALMQVAYNYEERGMRVLIMKPSIDTKGGEKLMSRLGVERRVDIAVRPDMDPLALVRADIAVRIAVSPVLFPRTGQVFCRKGGRGGTGTRRRRAVMQHISRVYKS